MLKRGIDVTLRLRGETFMVTSKHHHYITVLLTALRVWLGFQWLKAGWTKFGAFDATGYITDAINRMNSETFTLRGWYADILENIILPHVDVINILVPWGEVFVGFGLVFGILTLPALIGGAFMNVNFFLSGAFQTNPTFFTIALLLILCKDYTTYYSFDRFLFPNLFTKQEKKEIDKMRNDPKNLHKFV